MTKKKFKLIIIAPPSDYEREVICDDMDVSSSGYYSFFNKEKIRDNEYSRIYVGFYPIGRTVIESIEEINFTESENNKIKHDVEKI